LGDAEPKKEPWTKENPLWPFGPVKTPAYDQTQTPLGIFGLYSNAAEWTHEVASFYPGTMERRLAISGDPSLLEVDADSHIVRGGGWGVALGKPMANELAFGPRWRNWASRNHRQPGLGFAAPAANIRSFCMKPAEISMAQRRNYSSSSSSSKKSFMITFTRTKAPLGPIFT